MQAISIRNIIKDFRAGDENLRVLHGISTAIDAGELTMLVGPSGCGKTTLLSIITGILTPTSGEVDVLGERITAMRGRAKVEFRRRMLGFIFQQYHLLPALTAAENAAVTLLAAGESFTCAMDKSRALLAHLGLEAHSEKLPRQLSGGQQQRVAIARALVHAPRVIVCDEPTAALDAQAGLQVMQMLREAALQPDRAVLVVTHDSRIYSYADRIITMNDGAIISDERTAHA